MSNALFSTASTGKEDLDSIARSGQVDKVGFYHFEIAAVEPELTGRKQNGNPISRHINFKMVVMHSVPNQSPVGAMYYHTMWLESSKGPISEASLKQNLLWLQTLGVMEWREIDGQQKLVDTVTGSTDVTVDTFLRCKGKHCMAQVNFVPAQGEWKAKWEIPYQRIFRLTDEAVADKPKNMEIYKMCEEMNFSAPNMASPSQDGFAGVDDNF